MKCLYAEFDRYRGAAFDTVYLGGGTPSILDADQITEILSAVNRAFVIDENSEITIECNPSKDLHDDFKVYKTAGINRVSSGLPIAV